MLRKISGTVLTVLLRSAYPYTGRLLRPSSLGGTARLEATQTAHLSVPTLRLTPNGRTCRSWHLSRVVKSGGCPGV